MQLVVSHAALHHVYVVYIRRHIFQFAFTYIRYEKYIIIILIVGQADLIPDELRHQS